MKRIALSLCVLLAFVACAVAADEENPKVKKPFNGKDLEGWKAVNEKAVNSWKVGTAHIDRNDPKALHFHTLPKTEVKVEAAGVNVEVDVNRRRGPIPALLNMVGPDWKPQGTDLYSEMKFGDCVVELEFMVPKDSNSGIYLMGEYEVQILDSWGKEKMGPGDVGALYGAAPPKVNASLEPGKWQKIVIDFTAPKFDAEGKKTANARFNKITLNGQVVQENVEMKEQTPGGVTGKEASTGPLMFQGNHGPVGYRNIVVTEK